MGGKDRFTLSRKRAFTRVELLVVIAVIGILESLLLPAWSHAKAAAKSIDCTNNLRQIALVSHLYAADYKDFLRPYAGAELVDMFLPDSVSRLIKVWWYWRLWADYLGKNTNVFQCAGNLLRLRRILQREDLSKYAKRDLPYLFNFAYGANSIMLVSERILPEFEDFVEKGYRISVGQRYSRKMPEIVSPADCVAFGIGRIGIRTIHVCGLTGEWGLSLVSGLCRRFPIFRRLSIILLGLAAGILAVPTWLF